MSRRGVGQVLSVIAVAAASRSVSAQANAPARSVRQKLTDSKMYPHASVPYVGNDTKKGRRFFTGETHGGFNLEMHETILGAGIETHAPHKHEHEEIIVIVEGTVESVVDGKTTVLESGSVIWYGSNQMHSARNVGKVPSPYYVIELRGAEDV